MKKRYIIIALILLVLSLVVGCNNEKVNNKINRLYTEKEVKPISKETVINILRAEYGDIVATTIDEIEPLGDYYIVEVYVNLKDSEEEQESHEALGDHVHRQSLGKHKINMYTGEVLYEE
ncbi:MAG: hypothetical protein ACRDA3_09980 [Peptostreptococcaceae bacterium]